MKTLFLATLFGLTLCLYSPPVVALIVEDCGGPAYDENGCKPVRNCDDCLPLFFDPDLCCHDVMVCDGPKKSEQPNKKMPKTKKK
jgi:hypothetical protein